MQSEERKTDLKFIHSNGPLTTAIKGKVQKKTPVKLHSWNVEIFVELIEFNPLLEMVMSDAIEIMN